jgi:hypothetical protein
MSFWKPKGDHSVKGRIIHFILGLAATLIGGATKHYEGACWSAAGAAVLGIGWEVSTRLLAGHFGWNHPYGDGIDMGWVFMGAMMGLMLYTRRVRGKQ